MLRGPFQTRFACSVAIVMAVASCSRLTVDSPPPPLSEDGSRELTDPQEPNPARRAAAARQVSEAPSPSDEPPLDPRLFIKPYFEWTSAESAADALGRMGPAAVPELTQLLSDPSDRVRVASSRVLARIGPDAVGAVPDLIELLEDENLEVRRAAARALGQIGPGAAEAVPSLARLLEQVEEEESISTEAEGGDGP